jgi:hypothetical protein
MREHLGPEAKVKVLDRLLTNDPQLCSPMVFENLIYNFEGKTLDGAYISADSSRLLFEPEWGQKVTQAIMQAVRDTHL